MRYILFILISIGGLLSFNSYAIDCLSGVKLPPGSYFPLHTGSLLSGVPFFINLNGCQYVPLGSDYIAVTEGPLSGGVISTSGYISTGVQVLSDVPESFAYNNDGTLLDNSHSVPSDDSGSDDSMPVGGGSGSSDGADSGTGATGGTSDTGTTGSSGFSAQLSSINSSSADSLYLSYPFYYNFNYTAEQNKQLAQAFLSKLSNVTPSSYYEIYHIKNMMNNWQHNYDVITRKYHILDSWDSSRFVGGEHRYLGYIRLPVDSCTRLVTVSDSDGSTHTENQVSHLCNDKYEYFDINDPDYESESDYKNHVTRCMRNPNHPSCHSSGGSGDSSPAPVIPDVSGGSSSGSSDSSGSSSCPAGLFNVPGRGCLVVVCDVPGMHVVPGATPSDPPRCEKDSPGSSGVPSVMPGSGHTDSGDGDNGDVVAAINAFHADANKNHRETIDALDISGASLDSVKSGLASDINALIDSLKKEMTGGYNDALNEFKNTFGDIDSWIPDIKLSFDLPVQFTNGIRGRCVPLVFDFNIALVGFPPYHFHAEGVQACQLYDAYIRSIIEYMLYFITALACRSIFTRAAEFITSQP